VRENWIKRGKLELKNNCTIFCGGLLFR